MQDIEGRLGNASRRFDDWMDEDQFASRLTVIRSDGVPQTFESRAESHLEARRRVCLLAISANAMDNGDDADDGFGGPVNGLGGMTGEAYSPQTAGHGAPVPGSSSFAGLMSGSIHGALNASMHGAMHGSAIGAMPGAVQGPMPPGFTGAMPGYMGGFPCSMNGMFPWNMGGGGPFIAHPGIAPGSEAMGDPGRTGMMPMNIHPYMAMQAVPDMPGMQGIMSGAHTMPMPESMFPDRSAGPAGVLFGTGEHRQFLPDHETQAGVRGNAAFCNEVRLNPLKTLSKRHRSPQAHPVPNRRKSFPVPRKDWNGTQFSHRTSPIHRSASARERVETYSNGETKGSWYDVVDNITGKASVAGQQKISELSDSRAISGGRSRVVQENESSHSSDDTENAARGSNRRQYSSRVPAQNESGSSPSIFETKDDDDDNCLTKLNELCQKGVSGLRVPRYYYEHKSDCPGMTPVWSCTAVTSAQPSEMAEPIPLKVVVEGKNKKDARRVAAKHLLADLIKFGLVTQDIVDMKIPSAPNVLPEEQDVLCPSPNFTVPPEVAAAVSVLNQLWQKEKFACKPKWSVVPVSSGATGRWKCDLLIKTKQLGDIESSYTSSQKKTCRQMAAYKAVQRLTEMKFAGLCSVNINARQQSNVSAEAPDLDSDDDESSWIENEIDHPAPDTDVVAVPNPLENDPDIVSPFTGGDAGFGSLFCIPEDTQVVIAESEADCDNWVSDNIRRDAIFGLYLDSYDVRDVFKPHAVSAGIDVTSALYKSTDCHVICLASKTSALVVRADKFIDAHQSPRQSADLERSGSCLDDGGSCSPDSKTCGSILKIPATKKTWVPESIRLVLERRDCAKYGMALDEGMLVLHARHGTTCRGVNDLAIASFALKGMSGSRAQLLPKPDELVSDWLCHCLNPFSLRSVRSVSGLSEVATATADSILPAILTATASTAIQRRIAESAESRRRKLFPNKEEYSELCSRLCYPSTLMPSPTKNPARPETVMVAKHINSDNVSAPVSVV
jgi:hypothetical protein